MSQQINLLNPALIPQKQYLDAQKMLLLSSVVLVLMLTGYGYARYQFSLLERQAMQVTQQLDAAKASLADVSVKFAPRQPSEALKQEIAATEFRLASRERVLQALQGGSLELGGKVSAYMQALARQRVSGLWLTGFSIESGSGRLSISGRALEADLVPQYIAHLGEEPALQGKSFTALDISQGKVAPVTKDVKPSDGAANSAPAMQYIEFTLQSAESLAQDASSGSGVKP